MTCAGYLRERLERLNAEKRCWQLTKEILTFLAKAKKAANQTREKLRTLKGSSIGYGVRIVADLKTFIPSRQVWVSTVAWNCEIGIGRNAETMVFKGNSSGITDWHTLYFEPHGWIADKAVLQKIHRRIVKEIEGGKIKLEE